MPSVSLQRWRTSRASELDTIATAHKAVGGGGPGRRWATSQINQAYAVLLSSHFQGFCRDLHSECVDHLVNGISPTVFRSALRAEFLFARKIDRGNPNPGNIGADFTRLGVLFWMEVKKHDARNEARQTHLTSLSEWRNAIAHQDFLGGRLTPPILNLPVVKGWRSACNCLAFSFDQVMGRHIKAITRHSPW